MNSSPLYRLGLWCAHRPWRVIVTWLVVLAAGLGIAVAAGGTPVNDYVLPGTESQAGTDLLTEHLPAQSGATALVVVRDRRGPLPATVADAVAKRLSGVAHVSVVSPPRMSADGDTAMYRLVYDVPVTDEAVYGSIEPLQDAVDDASDGLEVAFGGEVPESAVKIGGMGEVIGIVAALVLLVIAFGSLVAAGLPLVVALFGLGLGSAAGLALTAVIDVSPFAPTVATMVGLGVGIDYALLLVTRFAEFRRSGLEIDESAARATATAGRAVVFAGTTVLVSLMGLGLGGLKTFESFGITTAITVTCVAAASLTLVPAFCRLAGDRLLGRRGRRHREASARPSLVQRWAVTVTAR
ncbi:MAG: MMPL family transporter, partial [Gordonia sp. (in: high G+C Gram-positive bacteria)]